MIRYATESIKNILSEVRLNASETANIYFPTKEYIKAVFNVVKKSKISATSKGSGGMHSGGAKIANKTGTTAPETYSAISAVSELLLFADIPGYIRRNNLSKIGTDKILKFPNIDTYRKSENKRKEYIANNPTYSDLLSNKFNEFLSSYAEDAMYIEEDPAENAKYYIQTDAKDGVLYGAFTKYINSGKGDAEWNKVINSEYVIGEDREIIHTAIKYFIDSNPEYVSKIIKSDVNADDNIFDPITTSELITSNPKITLSYQGLRDVLPSSFTGNIKNDVGHDYTLDLRNPNKNLLYLGSVTQDRVNDAKVADRGINANTKVYLFTLIDADSEGKFTQFPGRIILVHSFARSGGNNSTLSGLTPGYVYPVNITKGNYPNYPIVKSQLIGKEGEMINSIPIDNSVISNAISKGVKPNFNEPDKIDVSVNTNKENEKDNKEELKVGATFESTFMWLSHSTEILKDIL